MSKKLGHRKDGAELATSAALVCWSTALEIFSDTPNSPRTAGAYERAIREAMELMGLEFVADLTPPVLAKYRASLVARLDANREDRLSPSTVSLKLSALRSFLHFCRGNTNNRTTEHTLHHLSTESDADRAARRRKLSRRLRQRSPNTRLRNARERAGLTQAELARRVGVSPKTVCDWESHGAQPRSGRVRR